MLNPKLYVFRLGYCIRFVCETTNSGSISLHGEIVKILFPLTNSWQAEKPIRPTRPFGRLYDNWSDLQRR